MKSLLALYGCLLADAGRQCGVSTAMDLNTIRGRVDHEGLSFLTITLPEFAKGLEEALERSSVAVDMFPAFKSKGHALPLLFRGLMLQVFDQHGSLLPKPSTDAIRNIRLLSLFFGKLGDRCSPERELAAFDAYVQCEQDLHSLSLDPRFLEDFEYVASRLWSGLFTRLDNAIWRGDVLPKHGNGSTADRLRGNAKYNQREWPIRSTRSFPWWDFLVPSSSFLTEECDELVDLLEPGAERPVKVISVPKTQKTPRIIAMEPTCMQYMQQGLLEQFVKAISEDYFANHLIRFDDQTPNQALARLGSVSGALATLDLSEASDRVSWQLVKVMLSRHRVLRDAIEDCRSTRADVPGHGVITLAKFASMGSAVCFPVEALVFCTIVMTAIARSSENRGVPLSTVIKQSVGQVRVYGDDIIVPSRYAPSVVSLLETSGLKVNRRKSFWTGRFRESCGKDFYAGVDVSVVRCRDYLPRSRSESNRVVSAVSLRNQLAGWGYDEAVDYLDRRITAVIPFPWIKSVDSPVLGRVDPSRVVIEKMDPRLHIPLVRGVAPKPILPISRLDGMGALMKFFLKRSENPLEEGHLRRAGRSVSVTLKTRWAPPF